MACRTHYNATGKIETIDRADGKPSALFPQISALLSNDIVAQKLVFATDTNTFKSSYTGELSETGEPVLVQLKEGKTPTYGFINADKEVILSFVADKAYMAFNEADPKNINYIAEGIFNQDSDIDNRPLSLIQQTIAATNKDTMYDISVRHRAAYAMIVNNKRNYDNLGSKEIEGLIRRIDSDGNIIRGTGFNDDGLAQFLKEGYIVSDWDKKLSYGENKANQYWKDKDPNEIVIIGEDTYINKQAFIDEKNRNSNLGTLSGTVKHLYDEWIHASPLRRQSLKLKINDIVTKAIEEGLIKNSKYLSWMETIATHVLEREGITSETVVLHEQPFVNTILGINGRIDKIIIYPDGYISLREIKTSQRIGTSGYVELFKYGFKEYMEANPLNEAKVQVMLYALSMAIDNPKVKFTNLGIDLYTSLDSSISGANNISLSKEDVTRILSMINNMINSVALDPSSPISGIKTRLLKRAEIDKGLLDRINDVHTYINMPTVSAEKKNIGGKSTMATSFGQNTIEAAQQAVKELKMDMGFFYNPDTFKNKAYQDNIGFVRDRYEKSQQNINKFVSIMSGGGLATDIWEKDLSWLNFIVGGTTSNVRNALVDVYNNYMHQQMNKATSAYNSDMDKMFQYFLPVLNKYLVSIGKSPINTLDEKIYGLFNRSDFMGKNITKIWDSMFITENFEGQTKKYRKRVDQFKADQKEEVAFAKFLDAYYAKWLKGDEAFINQDATYRLNADGTAKVISHLAVMNGYGEGGKPSLNPFEYDKITTATTLEGKEVFIPFNPAAPMMTHEYDKKLEVGGKKNPFWKKYFVKYFTDFVDNNINQTESDNTRMVVMRYLGKNTQTGFDTTIDLAWAFSAFSKNMNSKVEMDDVAAIGSAMSEYLDHKDADKDEEQKTKRLSSFLRKQSAYQAKGKLPEDDPIVNVRQTMTDLFHLPIKVPITEGGATKHREYIINLHTFLRGLRSTATHVIMTLNPIGGVFNGIQAIFSSVKYGTSYSIGKWAIKGSKLEAFDFSAKDYGKGIIEWKQMQESAIGGNADKSKLFLLAREFSYLPKNLEYFALQEDSLTTPLKFLSFNSLAFMHTAAEEMNTMAILYAQMNALTVTTKSGEVIPMYKAYNVISEIENGVTTHKLKWRDDVGMRGTEKVGDSYIPIYGLTPKEIIKLKRVYERLQGNYRKEEKSYVELYALGQVMLQFRRFLPSMIRNQFQGRRADSSLGHYESTKIEEGPRTGETVLQWKERMISGKYYVLFNYFLGGIIAPFMKKRVKGGSVDGEVNKSNGVASSFEIMDQFRWDDMAPDEQVQVIDSLVTLGTMLALTLWSWKEAKDDGEKDSLAKALKRLSETVSQPWSLLQTISSMKNLSITGVSGNILFNQVSGLAEMFGNEAMWLSGMKDSPYNEQGNLPGFSKFIRNLPLMRSIKDLQSFGENWNRQGD